MMKRLMTAMATLFISFPVFAQEGMTTDKAWFAIGAALAIAIAAFGGAMGQGKAAAAALEGIARNPSASNKLFVPMIIALALIESLVIYAFVIAFLIKP